MCRYVIVCVVLAFFVLITSKERCSAQDLGSSFGKAQDIVRDFRLSGGSTGNVSDSSWRPSVYASSEPTPSAFEVSMNREIKSREERIRKLVGQREIWRVAGEKLDSAMNWQGELKYWVEDSQTAQLDALRSCTTLLFGVVGPVEEAIATHQYNASALWRAAEKSRERIEAVGGLFAKSLHSGRTMPPRVITALTEAETAFNDFTAHMKSESEVAGTFGKLRDISTAVEHVVTALEVTGVVVEYRHEIMIACHEMMQIAYDIMKDSGLDIVNATLIKKKLLSASGARLTGIANFAFDYGVHSLRFYYAWSGVDDVLGHMDDANKMAQIINQRRDEVTRQIKTLRAETEALKAVQKDPDKGKELLKTYCEQELTEAVNAGLWFLERSGCKTD